MRLAKYLLLMILCCAWLCPALGVAPPGCCPGLYDADGAILTVLQDTARQVTLRQTNLQDIAPQYLVKIDPTLGWEDAVHAATAQFPDDPIKRVLLLASYVKPDDPVSRIDEMQIPAVSSGGVCSGSGYVTYYELLGKAELAAWMNAKPNHTAHDKKTIVLPALPRSPISLVIAHTQEKILSRCSLELRDLPVNGMWFSTLHCEMDGQVTGFTRKVDLPKYRITGEVGGNTSGEGGKNFYYAQLQLAGKWNVTIDYSPDKIIERRWVYTTHGECLFSERYEDGRPAKRVWYAVVKTEHGQTSVIDRTETF